MNPLYLNGFGVRITVRELYSRSELQVQDGRGGNTYAFQPRQTPFDSIIIDGHSGYISMQALHWLSRNNIPIHVMNYDGTLICTILPPTPIKADIRAAQHKAANDPERKLHIAHALVEAKITRSIQVLEWLAERYDISRELLRVRKEAARLGKAKTVTRLRTVEGRTALRYWEAYGRVLNEGLRFRNRLTKTRPNNASDPVNLALNYGYGFLEGECRRAVNVVGLESAVGFLHELGGQETKQSLVYDLQEPFRWLIDLTVIEAFESGMLDADSFYFTEEDYRLRFDIEAKGRFLHLLREQFNGGAEYNGRLLKWDTVIQQKTSELARFFTGRDRRLSFLEPTPVLERSDNRAVRETILTLSQAQARERGIGKSTLHYLRKKADGQQPFKVYGKVREKITHEISK